MEFCRRACKYSRLLLALNLAWLICACGGAAAETISILNTPFRVDRLSPVDSRTIKVDLFGEKTLVAKEALEDFVVKTYFGHPARGGSLSSETIVQFVLNALKTVKPNYAAQALEVLIAEPGREPGMPPERLAEIAAQEGAQEVLKQVLSALTHGTNVSAADLSRQAPLIAGAVYWTALADSIWVRTRAVGWVHRFSGHFKGYIIEGCAQAALAGDLSLYKRNMDLAADFFGESDSLYRDLGLILKRVGQIQSAASRGEVENLYHLFETPQRDELSAKVLYPVLSDVFHREAEKALLRGLNHMALTLLTRLDFNRRTPRTHEITRKALAGLPAAGENIARDGAADLMLRRLAGSDEAIRQGYIDYLQRSISENLKTRHTDAAIFLLGRLVLLRRDPHPANDEMRVNISLAGIKAGDKRSARKILLEVQSGLSVWQRIRLAWAGFYMGRVWLLVLALVFMVCSVWLLVLQVKKHGKEHSGVDFTLKPELPQDDGENEEGAAFVRGVNPRSVNPKMAEYHRCLGILGLSPQASLKEIKTAYRQGVKRAHPDSAEVQTNRPSAHFIQLTTAYERALKLREEIGL